jgi:hypothetical protein
LGGEEGREARREGRREGGRTNVKGWQAEGKGYTDARRRCIGKGTQTLGRGVYFPWAQARKKAR